MQGNGCLIIWGTVPDFAWLKTEENHRKFRNNRCLQRFEPDTLRSVIWTKLLYVSLCNTGDCNMFCRNCNCIENYSVPYCLLFFFLCFALQSINCVSCVISRDCTLSIHLLCISSSAYFHIFQSCIQLDSVTAASKLVGGCVGAVLLFPARNNGFTFSQWKPGRSLLVVVYLCHVLN